MEISSNSALRVLSVGLSPFQGWRLDGVQSDEEHSASGLADIVGDLIENGEAERHRLPEVSFV